MATKKSTTEQFVYLIQAAEINSFKIGIARNPKSRFDTIQNASACDLTMLGYWPGGRKAERQIHRALIMYWRRGEWFTAPIEEIVAALSKFCAIPLLDVHYDIVNEKNRIESPKRKLVARSRRRGTLLPVLPRISKVHFEITSGRDVIAWYSPYSNMPKRRWVNMGHVPTDDLRSKESVRQWVKGRIESAGLNKYKPDDVLQQWLKMERKSDAPQRD